MKKNTCEMGKLTDLSIAECGQITGGNGFLDHLRCVRQALRDSPIKTVLFGATGLGLVRMVGIAVGCQG